MTVLVRGGGRGEGSDCSGEGGEGRGEGSDCCGEGGVGGGGLQCKCNMQQSLVQCLCVCLGCVRWSVHC